MRITQKLFMSHMITILLPIFAITAIFYISTKDSIKTYEMEKVGIIADLKVQIITDLFDEIIKDIHTAQMFYNIKINLPILIRLSGEKTDPSYLDAIKTLDSQLSQEIKNNRLLRLKLLNTAGKTVYSFDGVRHYEDEADGDVPELPKTFLSGGHERIWMSEIYKCQEKFAMTVAAPAFDLEDNPAGFIIFEIDMKPIYNNIQDVTGLGETGETLIGKRFGDEVIFLNTLRRDPQSALTRKIHIGSKFGVPLQKAVQSERGSGIFDDYYGHAVLSVWRYIPSLKWGLVAKIDVDEAFAPIGRLRNQVIIFLAMSIIFAFIVSFYVAGSIARPIHKLHEGTKMIGAGNLDYKFEIRASDEIGDLSRAFDSMANNLKDYQGKVVRWERLAAIGLLASSVAHELRNPLGVMKNVVYYLNMLKLGDSDPDVKDSLNIISQEIDSSDRIISDLLEFSRIKRPVKKAENINKLIKEALERMPEDLSGIAVSCELTDTLTDIKVDSLQIRQVFYNIIKNAAEAMGGGGKLTVRSSIDGGFVKISFIDTGFGIPKENLGKIFEPLFSTKTKGTGLGLSICNSLIEGHGGKIVAESEIGRGAIVSVYLPLEEGRVA